jgi:small subunit ribosomal protein S16
MLVIRLQKLGKKHTATFRVVVTEKTAGAGRKYLELLGNVDRKTKKVALNKEKILNWISKGAQPSDTVHNLLISNNIISGVKRAVHKISKKAVEAKAPETPKEVPAEVPVETPKETPVEAPVA